MTQNRGSFFSAMPPVTKNLLIINAIVWLASMILPGKLGIDFIELGGLHYWNATDFNPVQLFTYMFMHSTDSIAHLFFNMFTLFMFGTTLERVLGAKRFIFYYISCGIGAALIQEIVWTLSINDFISNGQEIVIANWAIGNNLTLSRAHELINTNPALASQLADVTDQIMNSLVTVGASGAIYGILLAFGMLFPNLPLYLLFIPFPIKAKWMVMGYGAIELLLGLSTANDGVAHFAHLGGMIFGLIMILYWKRNGTLRNNGYY